MQTSNPSEVAFGMVAPLASDSRLLTPRPGDTALPPTRCAWNEFMDLERSLEQRDTVAVGIGGTHVLRRPAVER